MSPDLFSPLTLTSGSTLPNRVAKAAMEESLAGPGQLPDERLVRLYRAWGAGGAGLLITGNVMVHAQALTGPGGVVLDDKAPLEPFTRWARAGQEHGAKMWMQISHPGRQVQSTMPGVVWAPSAVPVDLGRHSKRFGQPSAMTQAQIEATITRFATTARRAQEAGFDGVEIHAAHGYLLSQFLSPLVNRREDRWGGSLEHRAELLLEVVAAIRAAVSKDFAVAVKLNSADFQRGGFDAGDAAAVIELLAPLGVDLVELSGGSYESPAMTGRPAVTAPHHPAETSQDTGPDTAEHTPAEQRTAAREAYFLELAAELARTSPIPLMLTGGITRRATAKAVLDSGVAIVGMASAIALTPDLPARWRRGAEASAPLPAVSWSDPGLASLASMALVRHQMRRVTRGRRPSARPHPVHALVCDQLADRRSLRRYRSWLTARTPGA